MKNTTNRNMAHLAIAGAVLLGLNTWLWMGVRNGQFSPVDNLPLWSAFMVLNVVSLLWAFSLLGLQPIVLACSYAAGGFLAYRGVQGMVGISVAEVTTAGATYGAIGALAVGNATTKVRMAFFRKGQVPFIAVIIGLLLIDAVLNSRISGAGSSVVLNALVFPFVLAGVIVGLAWMVISRVAPSRKPKIGAMPSSMETPAVPALAEDDLSGAGQLTIQIPDTAEPEEEPVEIAAAALETAPEIESVEPEPVMAVEPQSEPLEESVQYDNFFPLEIDKDDDFVLPLEEDSANMDLAAMVASAPETVSDYAVETASPEIETEPMVETVEPEPEPEPVVEVPKIEVEKSASEDWLSGHLDLLNKISKSE